VMKISAVKPEHHLIEAPARVFLSQEDMKAAFKAGELDRDVVCVVRFQGPKANGMPELHGLTPPLAVLQDKGFKVALVTDGRMSGASGKVPAAIHVSPEAASGGAIAKLRDGDIVRVDGRTGRLTAGRHGRPVGQWLWHGAGDVQPVPPRRDDAGGRGVGIRMREWGSIRRVCPGFTPGPRG
jgi:dihydroxyacid dehydratase/phosphogluconate dehydratase